MTSPSEIQQLVLQPGRRRYTLARPAGCGTDGPRPLVLALHYAGHGTPFYGRGVLEGLVEPALRELAAVVAAPDCTGPDWTHPRSETDVLALLDHLCEAHPVDPQKTLITGFSMGGHGAWYLAARHPDRFAAAVVMAAWPPVAAFQAIWQVPLYLIHSRDDEVVPLADTERAVRQLQAQGSQVELRVIEGVTHYETYRFAGPLRSAVPWIQQTWEGRSGVRRAGAMGPEAGSREGC